MILRIAMTRNRPLTDRTASNAEIRALAAHDLAVRTRLVQAGTLWDGYHPEMAAVHRANAARLRELLAERSWPVEAEDGAETVEAAWLVVQHAIGEPDFQRAMLATLTAEMEAGRLAPARVAMLEDRIRAFEGRPQRWGTQADWGDDGQFEIRPPVEDLATVDARRAAIGLPPLAESLARLREAARREGARAPQDLAAHRAAADAWARSVGWR